MNYSDTEFVDKTAMENSDSDISKAIIREKDDSNNRNFIPKIKPIKAGVKIVKPDSESENDDDDDVPLSNLVAKIL